MMDLLVSRRFLVVLGACSLALACGNESSSATDTAATDTAGDDTAGGDTTADADASDCPSDTGGLCCCAGDVATSLVCVDGAWSCPSGFGTFKGDQCNGSVCGGPCSLPCPSPAVLCNNTGGKAVTATCCASTEDFPNTCAIGACGCAPASSHEVQSCECPSGQCFLPGTGCTKL